MSNPHEALARLKKANRLADILEIFSGGDQDAEHLADDGRRTTEQLAGVNVASDATWAMVPEIMRDRARARRLADAHIPSDPFDGLN